MRSEWSSGVLVWLAMVAGARRGELCALRWAHVDLGAGVLTIRRSVAQTGTQIWEKDTKTHQRRRITLDETTVALLRAFRSHVAAELAASAGQRHRLLPAASWWRRYG